MTNPFLRKLERYVPLSADHRREIKALTEPVQHFQARQNIIQDGENPQVVNVVMNGWACRYKLLPDGRRQIIALFLPGDMCDPYVFLLGHRDHALGTLTPVTLARVPSQAIRDLTASGPALAEALWWQTLIAIDIQREWTVSLGRRNAVERLAHLFCEVAARLAEVGLSDLSTCELPLTQADLADALGLSTVHINRVMQELRSSGLVALRNKRLTIHDREGLMDLAMFDPVYLHTRTSRRQGAP